MRTRPAPPPTSAAAVSYGHVALARFLLERGADPNIRDNDDDTPLHVCETVECAELLLDAGAQLDARNSDGLQARDPAVPARSVAPAAAPANTGRQARLPLRSGGCQPYETASEEDRVDVEALLRERAGLPPPEPKPDPEEILARVMNALDMGQIDAQDMEDADWEDQDDGDDDADDDGDLGREDAAGPR